jgi:hypothetical protein
MTRKVSGEGFRVTRDGGQKVDIIYDIGGAGGLALFKHDGENKERFRGGSMSSFGPLYEFIVTNDNYGEEGIFYIEVPKGYGGILINNQSDNSISMNAPQAGESFPEDNALIYIKIADDAVSSTNFSSAFGAFQGDQNNGADALLLHIGDGNYKKLEFSPTVQSYTLDSNGRANIGVVPPEKIRFMFFTGLNGGTPPEGAMGVYSFGGPDTIIASSAGATDDGQQIIVGVVA